MEFPFIEHSGTPPSILVVNIQLSKSYAKELPPHFQENIRGVFTSCLFIDIRSLANVEDVQLSAVETKLMQVYNEIPGPSHPQHEFYKLILVTRLIAYASHMSCPVNFTQAVEFVI
uniref:Uncharacterized protein n=1 Tax=Solanum lycopersicum TaxID=4081 RepID=K4BNI1_SOLLC